MAKRFKRIHVEISNICNVQCSYCPVVEREKEVLSVKKFESLLREVSPLTEEVCLHLMGEPLAHPHFAEVLKVSDRENIALNLTTNGILIKKYSDILLKSKSLRQINFSLQTWTDNFPEKPIEIYFRPIINFVQLALQKREDAYVNFRLWNLGASEHSDNELFFKMIEKEFNVEIKRQVDPSSIKSKKLIADKKLYLHFDTRFDWPSPYFPLGEEVGTCYGLRNHIGIHANGEVVPCCLDKEANLSLGNVFEKTLEDILDSTKSLAIKEGFERGVIVEDFCRRCTFKNRFGRKLSKKN